MIDPTNVLRVIATTTLYFGIGGSTPTGSSTLAISAHSSGQPTMRHDAVKADVLPPPSRRLQRSVWI